MAWRASSSVNPTRAQLKWSRIHAISVERDAAVHASGKAPVGSGDEQASPAKGTGESGPPSWTRLIIGLLIALVLASIMATTYITADHAVVAHNLPWGQVGSSPLTTTVQKSISLQLHQYASESDLEQAANESKIYGGFVAQGNTLILSEAASLRAPGVMTDAYEQAAKAERPEAPGQGDQQIPLPGPRGCRPWHRPDRPADRGLPGRYVRHDAHQDDGTPPPGRSPARLLGRRGPGDRPDRRADSRRLPRHREQLLGAVA